MEHEHDELKEKYRRFSVFRENLAKAREWQKEHDQLEKKSSHYAERMGQLREMQREIDRERTGIQVRLGQSAAKEKKYLEDIRTLQRPDQTWATSGTIQLPDSFEEMQCALSRITCQAEGA